jgi:Holliday junction resolvase RusA-like endonuclease
MLTVPIEKGTPITLSALFVFPYPASLSAKKRAANPQHTKKPDADNLLKFIKDCANGILWHDDSQVNNLTARKEYGENPRTEIEIQW